MSIFKDNRDNLEDWVDQLLDLKQSEMIRLLAHRFDSDPSLVANSHNLHPKTQSLLAAIQLADITIRTGESIPNILDRLDEEALKVHEAAEEMGVGFHELLGALSYKKHQEGGDDE